ncbi:MAG: hypothetical protein K2X94_00510 [Amoebophilaceae bacterium]|nr:hypothetical protein [Amoebophilaceae bacterium]
MLELIGLKENLKTIYLLSHKYLEFGNIDAEKIKKAYHHFLLEEQPNYSIERSGDIAYISSGPNFERLVSYFNADSIFHDEKNLLSPSASDHIKKEIQVKLSAIEQLNPKLFEVFDLLVHSILISACENSYGGTHSKAIGVLCISPIVSSWTIDVFYEFICHELTHMLMFLDEHRFTHFIDIYAAAQKENYSVSAILAKNRPLDKVLHSIVVSVEIILSRNKVFKNQNQSNVLHPDTSTLIRQTRQSITKILAMINIKSMLSHRAFDLLEKCSKTIENLNPNF